MGRLWMLGLAALVGCAFPDYTADQGASHDATSPPDSTGDASCADLPEGATLACGTCGKLECVGGVYGTCVEPTPKPGTVCGTCSTSTYTCRSPGTSTCGVTDDRKEGTDYRFVAVAPFDNHIVSRSVQLAISYVVHNDGDLVRVRLTLQRTAFTGCSYSGVNPPLDPACGGCTPNGVGGFNCSVTTPNAGSLIVEIYRGSPDLKLDKPVAVVKVDPATISDTLPATGDPSTTFEMPKPFTAWKKGDPLTIVINNDSTTSATYLVGVRNDKTGLTPEHKSWQRAVYPAGTWSQYLNRSAAVDVQLKGCF